MDDLSLQLARNRVNRKKMDCRSLSGILIVCVAVLTGIFTSPAFNKYMEWKPKITFADLVVKNGVLYTSDAQLPWAQAMAVSHGRILAIGDFTSVKKFIGKETQILDLRGKMAVPGFIDSHVHLIPGGLQMGHVDLHSVKTKEEFIKKIEQSAIGMESGRWILGGGWNNDNWGGEMPDASWIDSETKQNPVWLIRMDGHMGLANSVAIRNAGINDIFDDIEGGIIVKNDVGVPTGLLVDAAMQLISSHIPESTVEERRDAMLRASRLALSKGITGVVDFGRYYPGISTTKVWEDFFDVYKWADETGQMLIRVWLFFPMETWHQVVELQNSSGKNLSNWLHVNGVKAFADGSLGSNSALFFEPYADDEQNYGLHVADHSWLLQNALESDKAGLQVAIHAIGDKANAMVLSINSELINRNGMKDRRFRIEHAQHLVPESVKLFDFERSRVIASMQPQHLLYDAKSVEKKLGERRAAEESYVFQSLLLNNAQLAFGSDWPVVPLNAIGGIDAATKRLPPNFKHPWIESEQISVEAAINSYTSGAAFSVFMENELGSLSVGKSADFVILSKSLWNITNVEDPHTVLATYIKGRQVYP